jgi:hypothetical protein
VIDHLAVDLKRAFPDIKGFSPRNLKYMRQFAEVWAEDFVQQLAAQLPWFHNSICFLTIRPRREVIESGRSRGGNAKAAVCQDLVDDHSFTGGYQSLSPFISSACIQ